VASMNIKAARKQFSDIVRAAERGETVVLTRRGKSVARIAPAAEAGGAPLPDLRAFRASIARKGQPLSRTVVGLRDEERY